jgi:putative protein kinase ArgK-like GTPase of G3E family
VQIRRMPDALRVSSLTGEGLDELKAAILRVCAQLQAHREKQAQREARALHARQVARGPSPEALKADDALASAHSELQNLPQSAV